MPSWHYHRCSKIFWGFQIFIWREAAIRVWHALKPFRQSSTVIIILINYNLNDINQNPCEVFDEITMRQWFIFQSKRVIIGDISGNPLTQWAEWRMHASVQHTNIGSDNGLSPVRPQAIIWTNADMFQIRL